MSTDNANETNFNMWLEARVTTKTRLANEIINSDSVRQELLDKVNPWKEGLTEKADVAIMLGTSPQFSKFEDRVRFTTGLLNDKKVSSVIFTGKSDRETGDQDQAKSAANLAQSQFDVDEKKIHLAGGNNTEENLHTALETIRRELPNTKSVLIISEAPHLLRANVLAQEIFGPQGIESKVLPVDDNTELDTNDPHVITELVKMAVYHNTIENGPEMTTDERRLLKDRFRPIINQLTRQIYAKFKPSSLLQ